MLREKNYSGWQLWSLVILRVAIGWHFMYEGITKLLNPNWSSMGYLMDSKGLFGGMFQAMAGNAGVLNVMDFLNVWGLVLMPLYSFSEQRQIVLRYTYIDSSDDNGISLGRYEREVVSGRGDSYNEFYAGLNVYIYGQKLKWQTGLQYTKMDDAADDGGDYSGWGLTTGMRMYW